MTCNSGGDAAVARLQAAGFELPEPNGTEYDYLPALRYGCNVYVAGQIPKITADRLSAYGALGREVSFEEACAATQLAVLQSLAWIRRLVGNLDARVDQVLRMNFHFQVTESGASEMSRIADAGSRLMVLALRERGRHPRSVIGVRELPRNAPVLVDIDLALRQT